LSRRSFSVSGGAGAFRDNLSGKKEAVFTAQRGSVIRRALILGSALLLMLSLAAAPARAADTRAAVDVTANGNFQLVFPGQSAQVVGQVLPVYPTPLVPTGTVTLLPDDADTPLGTSGLSNDILPGLFVLIAPPLDLGTHYFRAAYSGDENFAPKTIRFPIVVISGPETTTSLALSPSGGSVAGEVITMTAQVAALDGPLTGTPLGEVTFTVDGVDVATVTVGTGWVAAFSTSALTVGTHTISAAYQHQAGDYFASTSPALSYTVSAPPTAEVRTQFRVSPHGTVQAGEPVTARAVIESRSSHGPTPTGRVQFYDGSTPIGAAEELAAGTAVFVYQQLSPGKHVLQAKYLGSSLYLPAFTPSRTVTVTA